jgi:hypothetical protein
VPGEEPGVALLKEGPRKLDPAAPVLAPPLLGALPDAQDGYGVHGGLAEPAGRPFVGCIFGEGAGVPALGVGEVAFRRGVGVEDYVGQFPRGPLGAEEAFELLGGSPVVEVGKAQGDEGAVPAPLVGVQRGGGLGPVLQAVAPQNARGQRVHPREASPAARGVG